MGFGPPGFLHAPASKATTACVFLASLLVHTEHLSASRVSLTPRAVFGVGAHGRQLFSRLVLSNLAFASKGETAVGLALWYRLARDAERKRGTDRYAAFLFVVAAVAVAAQTAAMALFGEKNQKLSPFASGPHALVWAHLPGFALDVPATWHAEFELGGRRWKISSKSSAYVAFLLLARFALASSTDATGGGSHLYRSVLSSLTRLAPGALGILAALALRASWVPLNVEARRRAARSRGRGAAATAATAASRRGRRAFSRRRWWPALVRALCSATLGWLTVDPGAARAGNPRVFVAGTNDSRARREGDARGATTRRARGPAGFDGGVGDRFAARPPPAESVAALTAMGFDEGSVRRALADAGNDLAVATESLLDDGAR